MQSHAELERDIAETEKQLAQLKRSAAKLASPGSENDPENDWLDGGEAIAAFLNWPVKRVYKVYGTGKFRGAVFKTGWRTMIGSRARLRALPELLLSKP
jgi:hypothetical protein